jgi:hypothetical protein
MQQRLQKEVYLLNGYKDGSEPPSNTIRCAEEIWDVQRVVCAAEVISSSIYSATACVLLDLFLEVYGWDKVRSTASDDKNPD